MKFEFGQNWLDFIRFLNSDRIREAEQSLASMLGVNDMRGLTFLDVGCGSGLFSLAALNMGASVKSFDFDLHSVQSCIKLREKYSGVDAPWQIEAGSVLDRSYCSALGQYDVVYSWGVLHHTGDMWGAIDNVIKLVRDIGGMLFIAIYNDQGAISHRWAFIKKLYNRLPRVLRPAYALLVVAPREFKDFLGYLLRLRPFGYVNKILNYKKNRGMSYWHDIIDWVGGYPFEVATPDQIFDRLHANGFQLAKLVTSFGGCNEFVFLKS